MASDQTINTIAKALGEADEGPLAQIKAVVDNLGDQACLTLLAETEKIEKAGGLMRGDGSGYVGHNGGAPGMNGDLRIYAGGYVTVALANLDPPVADDATEFLDARLPLVR